MDYKIAFENAVAQTLGLGLTLNANPIPLHVSPISKEQMQPALVQCIRILRERGYFTSKELNTKCVDVHLLIKQFLKFMFDIETHITIGSMKVQGWDYCSMTYNYILQELASPNFHQEIRAHVWLTLPDGSIIDWTGQAWHDIQIGEVHSVENCLLYFSPNEFRDDLYHKPYLVGEDFLLKTGIIGLR